MTKFNELNTLLSARIEQLISEVLEEWKHTQLNISSEAGRKLLTKAIVEKLKQAARK